MVILNILIKNIYYEDVKIDVKVIYVIDFLQLS